MLSEMPPLVADIVLSLDDKYLYFSNWLRGGWEGRWHACESVCIPNTRSISCPLVSVLPHLAELWGIRLAVWLLLLWLLLLRWLPDPASPLSSLTFARKAIRGACRGAHA